MSNIILHIAFFNCNLTLGTSKKWCVCVCTTCILYFYTVVIVILYCQRVGTQPIIKTNNNNTRFYISLVNYKTANCDERYYVLFIIRNIFYSNFIMIINNNTKQHCAQTR